MKKNFDNKSIGLGAVIAVVAMIAPKVSDYVVPVITSIRNKIGKKA